MNTLTATTENLQAAGFFDWSNNIINNVQGTLGGLLIVIGLLVFIITAWSTKTIPGVIGGIVAGAIIAGAGVIIVSLSGVFQQTIEEGNSTAAPTSIISTTESNLS